MKSMLIFSLCVAPWTAPLIAAEDQQALDATVSRAVIDYTKRLEIATRQIGEARITISNERAPLMDEIRADEEKIAQLQATVARLQVDQARAQEKAQALRVEQAAIDRNLSYVTNIALDGFKSFEGNLLPGEAATLGGEASALRARVESASHPEDAFAGLDAAELFIARLRRQLGGYTAPGSSLVDGDNQILEGTFAFIGPDVLFKSKAGAITGTVRPRKDSDYVVAYPLPAWKSERADALFRGEKSTIPADASGGKALRLHETKGGLWKELRKAGLVGYVIMALGAVSVLITCMKLLDLRQLAVDSPATMQRALSAVARGSRADAEAAAQSLQATTRELFSTGLRHADGPRLLLEEHLEGFVLRQRLHHERRLPLLAVIATAGPLLGLLGTVTGMIKTFTLITVFGTGSAGKLSGGISEALVATELGLAVAIPTLVIHGFLAHRIHKGLSLLERYALEFVTAVEENRASKTPELTSAR
jgi:biopolymer transport protein ExbB